MRVTLALLRAAAQEAWSNRKSLLSEATIMVVSDLTWLVFWLLLLHGAGPLRGWTPDRIVVLLAITTTGVGLGLGLCGNVRHLGRLIANGEIDALLTLPASPLKLLLFRRLEAFAFGDVTFGLLLFLLAGHPTPARLALLVAGSVVGAVVLISFLTLLGSLTFFIGGRGEVAEFGFFAVVTLVMYPLDFFGGLTKVLLFTMLPAAFITGLPARLVDTFSLGQAGFLAAAAAAFVLIARITFGVGLRRYRSGSAWTSA